MIGGHSPYLHHQQPILPEAELGSRDHPSTSITNNQSILEQGL